MEHIALDERMVLAYSRREGTAALSLPSPCSARAPRSGMGVPWNCSGVSLCCASGHRRVHAAPLCFGQPQVRGNRKCTTGRVPSAEQSKLWQLTLCPLPFHELLPWSLCHLIHSVVPSTEPLGQV